MAKPANKYKKTMMRNKTFFRLFYIFALVTLLLPMVAMAQSENVKINPEISYSSIPQTYKVQGIIIDGVDEYDHDILLGISGLSIGQTITIPKPDDQISTAIRNFWERGLFSDVSIAIDSIIDNQIYLHINLTARPRLTSITFNGIKKTEKEDLEKKVGFVAGNQISTSALNRAEYIIKNYYDEKSYSNVSVEFIQKDDPDKKNHVILDINIDKHEKIKVHKIYVSGVDKEMVKQTKKAMSSSKIREVHKLKNIFKGKKYSEEKYNDAKKSVVAKFNELGYRDAYIIEDSVKQYEEKYVDLYLNLYQGDKYYLRDVSWVGNTVYSTEVLNSLLQMKKGDIYNQTLLTKRLDAGGGDEDAIPNLYYNNGYVFSEVVPVEINIDGDSIDLEIRINEGQQAHLNHVKILGNDRVYEDVIRRELQTKPGDLFNREALMRSIRDIASMGHFDPEKLNEGLKVEPDRTNGTVDVTYALESKSSDQLELSFGWGSIGLTGRVAVKFTNFAINNLFRKEGNKRAILPQGEGQQLELSLNTNGTYYQQYSISFLDPWFGKKRPNQFSASMFYSKQTDVNSNYYNSSYYNNYYNSMYGYGMNNYYYNDYTNYYDPDKYMQMVGVSVGWGRRLRWPDNYFTFSAMLTYQRYMLKQWKYFIMTDGDCNSAFLTLSLSRNSTDQQFFPRRGSDFEVSAAFTPPYSLWDGKDYASLANNPQSPTYKNEMKEKYRWVEYHKWKFRLKTFTALTNANKCFVLMTRTEFGLLGHYNQHKRSPFETFYVGGDGMSGYSTGYCTETIGLRGYDNGSLTPYGFESYAYSRMSLELRYPLMLSGQTSIYALTFLEGGNAWTETKKFNPFDMKRSAGAGLRLFLPMVGLMGVDWAYGFDKVYGNKGGSNFHFIIGREF